jgi:D-sedoheptulose 7-phosphate isomerase
MKHFFLHNLTEQIDLLNKLKSIDQSVLAASLACSNSLKAGGKLMFCGNGGSAADSQHLSAELTGRFVKNRSPIAAIALSTDTSAITCISNDYSFEEIFSRQIEGIGKSGDVLLTISTSGNSRNLLRAAEVARKKKIFVIGFLGRDGGELREFCDVAMVVPSTVTARIQESHILIGHTICEMIENQLGLV